MRLLPVLLYLIASVAECLMLSRVLVPQYKLFGEDALLKCEYDLGRDRLYAVKWYKDNEEFFRYVPRFNPPIYTHPVDGVRVESSKSNDKRVLLRSVTVRSTGVYRCEVSAEAPSFASIMGEGRMTVVYLPKEAPQITGNVREEYEVGDVLDLNCTSSKSFPPAKISWYINDNPVEVPWSVSLRPASPDPPLMDTYDGGGHHQRHGVGSGSVGGSSNSLMISSLRLQLQLRQQHFGPKGTAKVRCVARISPLFWQDGDEKTFGYSSSSSSSASSTSSSSSNSYHHHQSNQVRHNHDDMSNKKTDFVKYHHNSPHGGDEVDGEVEVDTNGRMKSKSIHTIPFDHDQHSTFGQGLSFQREALVLVRGGCSSRFVLPGGGHQLSWLSLCASCLFLVLTTTTLQVRWSV